MCAHGPANTMLAVEPDFALLESHTLAVRGISATVCHVNRQVRHLRWFCSQHTIVRPTVWAFREAIAECYSMQTCLR